MNFEEWYESEWKKRGYAHNKVDCKLAWDACRKELLNIVKNTKAPKVPGMEGLGGYSWEEMDAETFRGILIKEMEKL
jgi:hypothetical protein